MKDATNQDATKKPTSLAHLSLLPPANAAENL